MKKAGLALVSFSLLLFFVASYSYAENIQTGNATAKTTVNSSYNGSNGSSATHIETTVNGKTEVIDTTGNGAIEVTNTNGEVTIKKSPDISVTIAPTKISTPSPSITQTKEIEERKISLVSIVFEKISNFIKRVFTNL